MKLAAKSLVAGPALTLMVNHYGIKIKVKRGNPLPQNNVELVNIKIEDLLLGLHQAEHTRSMCLSHHQDMG